jgi:hypothetical protein
MPADDRTSKWKDAADSIIKRMRQGDDIGYSSTATMFESMFIAALARYRSHAVSLHG